MNIDAGVNVTTNSSSDMPNTSLYQGKEIDIQANKKSQAHEHIEENIQKKVKQNNETQIVLTPKMFKDTLNEAILQFARRMKLGKHMHGEKNDSHTSSNDVEKHLTESKENSIEEKHSDDSEKTKKQINQNESTGLNETNKSVTEDSGTPSHLLSTLGGDEIHNIRCINHTAECLNQKNAAEPISATSDFLRLFEMFFTNKKIAPVNLRYDTNNQLVDDNSPNVNIENSTPQVDEDSVRKSILVNSQTMLLLIKS